MSFDNFSGPFYENQMDFSHSKVQKKYSIFIVQYLNEESHKWICHLQLINHNNNGNNS